MKGSVTFMTKRLTNIAKMLNKLELDTYHYSLSYMEDNTYPIDDKKPLGDEFNHTLDVLKRNYGTKFVDKTLGSMFIMSIPKAKSLIPKLKNKYKYKQDADFDIDNFKRLEKDQYVHLDTSDGSLVEFDYIRYFDIRTIINKFRMTLKIPLNKLQVERQLIMDMDLNSSEISETAFEEECDAEDSDDVRDLDNMSVMNGYGNSMNNEVPLIEQLKKIVHSPYDKYRIIKCFRVYYDDMLDYQYLVTEEFKPIKSASRVKHIDLGPKFYTKLQAIADVVPNLSINSSLDEKGLENNGQDDFDLEDALDDQANELYDTLSSLINIINSKTDRFIKHKGKMTSVIFYKLNKHDLSNLKSLLPKMTKLASRIDHWAKSNNMVGSKSWNTLYKKQDKAITLIDNCHLKDHRIIHFFSSCIDAIKHHDSVNDTGYYYAYNIKGIADKTKIILKENKL